jgi:hypothetical protein
MKYTIATRLKILIPTVRKNEFQNGAPIPIVIKNDINVQSAKNFVVDKDVAFEPALVYQYETPRTGLSSSFSA